ncbi:hypothetical protein GGR53DRAFT_522153 [Hypoxylon sp. FL1150]|nr:hypothetical protein GGR53DRAFT_522153 [Hypoxylon sp. FL1150]
MERDIRRDRSQWRGCHTFNDIICDGDQAGTSKRSGGLKMGQTYYYYYELDGSTETHDSTMPTTNACPYLPGQTVNTLEVPLEHTLSRNRSASMNSLRTTDFKTMNPKDKFMTPRPAPPVPSLPDLRLGSAPAMSLVYKRSARSLSPVPRWQGAARRFFGRKKGCYQDSDAGSETEVDSHNGDEVKHFEEPPRSSTPSGSVRSVRSRDMSPESLRRFLLSDDLPQAPSVVEPTAKLAIPDEIIEENEDDDNFATSAVSETAPFTVLSPPPFQRSTSLSSNEGNKNKSTTTIVPISPTNAVEPDGARPGLVDMKLDLPRSHFSFSTTSSSLVSPASPRSPESRDLSQYSFFDESDDEGEDVFSNSDESSIQGARLSNDESRRIPKHIRSPITGYSLPRQATHNDKPIDTSRISPAPLGSPDLVTRVDSGNVGLLSQPGADTGLEDLVTDMGWMADAIQSKYI